MADLDTVLAANRAAVDDLIAVMDRCESIWTTPRAPGKWSPSQVVEHVARALESCAKETSGTASDLPSLPFFVRPVARRLFFQRVLRSGVFPKAKTNRRMDPEQGPRTIIEGRARLLAAVERFDRACRARAETHDTVKSLAFGKLPLVDYARFQELHTRHHTKQIPVA